MPTPSQSNSPRLAAIITPEQLKASLQSLPIDENDEPHADWEGPLCENMLPYVKAIQETSMGSLPIGVAFAATVLSAIEWHLIQTEKNRA